MRKLSLSNKFLFLLNFLAAVALLIAYLAAVVHPASFWVPSFFGLLYPLWLLVCLLFLFYWLFKAPRRVWISLMVLLPFLSIHLRYFSFSGGAAVEETDVRVVSWNVRLFNKYESDRFEYAEEMIDFLSEQDADIICLQEFYTDPNSAKLNYLTKLKSATGLRYHYMEPSYRYPSGASWGIVLLSRFPLLEKGALDFTASFTRNGCLYTDFEVEGKRLRVFNTHLQSIKLTPADLEHVGSVSGITETEKSRALLSKFSHAWAQRAVQSDSLANAVDAAEVPVIVCGDFNDTPVSYAYRRVSRGMQDAFVKVGSGLGRSYAGFPGLRIDYLLFEPEFQLRDYSSPSLPYSDHYPVIADFRWKP